MKHEDLVKLAVKWLHARGCSVILSEIVSAMFAMIGDVRYA